MSAWSVGRAPRALVMCALIVGLFAAPALVTGCSEHATAVQTPTEHGEIDDDKLKREAAIEARGEITRGNVRAKADELEKKIRAEMR